MSLTSANLTGLFLEFMLPRQPGLHSWPCRITSGPSFTTYKCIHTTRVATCNPACRNAHSAQLPLAHLHVLNTRKRLRGLGRKQVGHAMNASNLPKPTILHGMAPSIQSARSHKSKKHTNAKHHTRIGATVTIMWCTSCQIELHVQARLTGSVHSRVNTET